MVDFIKTMENIKPNYEYTPQEIQALGVIKTRRGKSYYNFILKEIEAGRLKAVNKGKGKTPYYYVFGKDIIKYLEKYSLETNLAPHGVNL